MGGSGPNPSTDRPDKKKKRKEEEEAEELLIYLRTYINMHLIPTLQAWGSTYGHDEAICWLIRIEHKLKKLIETLGRNDATYSLITPFERNLMMLKKSFYSKKSYDLVTKADWTIVKNMQKELEKLDD